MVLRGCLIRPQDLPKSNVLSTTDLSQYATLDLHSQKQQSQSPFKKTSTLHGMRNLSIMSMTGHDSVMTWQFDIEWNHDSPTILSLHRHPYVHNLPSSRFIRNNKLKTRDYVTGEVRLKLAYVKSKSMN
jgi:hypothetical protein